MSPLCEISLLLSSAKRFVHVYLLTCNMVGYRTAVTVFLYGFGLLEADGLMADSLERQTYDICSILYSFLTCFFRSRALLLVRYC